MEGTGEPRRRWRRAAAVEGSNSGGQWLRVVATEDGGGSGQHRRRVL